MAVINFTRSEPSASKAKIVTRSAIANADTAAPFLPVEFDTAIASVQISGTFGGATLTFQQSNDGTNWFTAKTPTGDNVTATAAGMFEVSLSGLYVRPSISGGSVPRARSWKYKLPAFESAAQAAGMDYSMDTVNEMVLLVNEGHTLSSAAKVVANKRRKSGQPMKKAGTPVSRMVT